MRLQPHEIEHHVNRWYAWLYGSVTQDEIARILKEYAAQQEETKMAVVKKSGSVEASAKDAKMVEAVKTEKVKKIADVLPTTASTKKSGATKQTKISGVKGNPFREGSNRSLAYEVCAAAKNHADAVKKLAESLKKDEKVATSYVSWIGRNFPVLAKNLTE